MFKKSNTSEMQQLRAAGFSLANADRLSRKKRGSGAVLMGCSAVGLVLTAGIIALVFDLTRSVETATQQAQVSPSASAAAPVIAAVSAQGATPVSVPDPAVALVQPATSDAVDLGSETLRNLQATQLTQSFAAPMQNALSEETTRTQSGISARLDALTTAASLQSPPATTEQSADAPEPDCVATLGDTVRGVNINFEMASTTLPAEISDALGDLVSGLQTCGTARLMVKGHSDSTGPETANLQISWQRADTTMSRLIELGAPATQLEAIGFGTRVPLTPATPTTAPENRRVDFRVIRREEVQG